MSFLLTHLDDETNSRRNRRGHAAQPDTSRQSPLQAAIEYWGNHTYYSNSIVDRYWRLLELGITECHSCNSRTYNFRTANMISPSIGNDDMRLEKVIAEHTKGNILDDFFCDKCKVQRKATTSMTYPRMPSLLCIAFNRFDVNPRGHISKSTAKIEWDLNDFDMSPCFLKPNDCTTDSPPTDKAFKGRFGYQCFAVVEHSGSSAGSGHYTAYVRDPRTADPSAWLYCNDANVSKVRMDHDQRQRLFKSGDRVPYLAFFSRKYGS